MPLRQPTHQKLPQLPAPCPTPVIPNPLFFGGFGIWWLYDLVLIIAGDFRDADERPLRRWGVPDPATSGAAAGEVRQLTEQLDALRNEVADLAERMDFAERMLAKQRDRDRLRPGG